MSDSCRLESGCEKKLAGAGVSPGLAVGRAFVYRDILLRDHELYDIEPGEIERELARIRKAFADVAEDLAATADTIEEELDMDNASIFIAQKGILEDPTLMEQIESELENELVNAEHVVKSVFHRIERKFKNLQDERFSSRAEDVADLARRVLRTLVGIHVHSLEAIPDGSILVARRLMPSDTVQLSRHSTVGVVVARGGPVSHSSLLAREMGIPAVSRIEGLLEQVTTGDTLIVDGDAGNVYVNPSPALIAGYAGKIRDRRRRSRRARESCGEPARSRDGVLVKVMANIGCREDSELAAVNGADGIGLYRIESLFLAQKTLPAEEELVGYLKTSIEPLGDKPVVIRLLDIGGDKNITYLTLPEEPNPFLGRRGIRLLLEYPDLLRSQFRAMSMLSLDHDIRIMVPMVTLAGEMKRVRDVLHQVAGELALDSPPPLGAMIETPAAALCLSEIARYADFVSVGTNDLTQYTMAAGRENVFVSDYFIDTHPAVWQLLSMIMEQAGDTPVSVCGELAGNTTALPRLLEHGVTSVSVAPPMVAAVKDTVRKTAIRS